MKEMDPGAAASLNGLYRRYSGWLGRRLRGRVGADEAADVVQETYLRLAPYLLEDIRHPKALLLRVALNLVRDERRRMALRDRAMQGAIPMWVTAADAPVDRLHLKQVRRAVELASGQAFFDVEGDPARPFVVRAGATDVTALGTRFDVRRAGGGAQVTLVEGKVDVVDRGQATPRWSLAPGQQIVTASPRPAVRSVDAASETSWTVGRLIFAGDTVEAAVAEVNRYTASKVVLDAPAIADIAVSGAFNTGDVEGFVSALTELYPVVANRTASGQIVIRDAPAKNASVR
ncbi:FecR domain-containing protein [Brevundimonas sp.]|uniref:FecR domain-containing protein n=1 Tax=Brevundimonas sp. TaxID=1871086 RepID=UPI003F6F5555